MLVAWCFGKVPFATPADRADHFQRHGSDFGAVNEMEYEAKAESFLKGPKNATTYEQIRACGDVVRFDSASNEFGVVAANGDIRTYFIPIPGVTHRYQSNLAYFQATCKRY
jgi:pyocin large subunit-like protein